MSAITLTVPQQFAMIGRPSTPGPADRVGARILQITTQHELPGQWAANRYEQLNHFTGVVWIAVKHYTDHFLGARFNVLEKRVKKSVAGGGAGGYGQDDEYRPADPQHPLWHILQHPGGEEGAWSIQQECSYLMLQKLLTGDAPAWMPRNDAGKPVQFYALTGAMVTPQFLAGNPMYPNGAYRVYQNAGGSMFVAGLGAASAILPGEEVRHYRDMHAMWRNVGYSRLSGGALEIDVLEAITRSRHSYFDQGLQLDSVLYLPGADQGECVRVQQELTQKHGGARNARKLAVIGGAGNFDTAGKPLTVQQLGAGARELDYTSSYEQAAKVVLALFRVPGLLSGLQESGSSYAADWAAQQRFWDLAIRPEARALSEFLTLNLAKPWSEFDGQYRIEVEIDPPQNIEERAKELQFALQQGVIDYNEYRLATNRKPKPDGDVPLSVYMSVAEQAVQPQPMPGADPNAPPGAPPGEIPPGADQGAPPDEMAGDPQQMPQGEPGADEGPQDDAGAQDALVQAALASLGLGSDQEAPEGVEKARQKRNEGDRWQDKRGQWYSKIRGKIVPISNPNGRQPRGGTGQKPSAPVGQQPGQKPAPQQAGQQKPQQPASGSRPQQVGPDEPPVKPGHVRVYHGGDLPGRGGARWVAATRKYAEDWTAKSGGGVHYVDVPESHPLIKEQLDAAEWSAGRRDPAAMGHFEVPEEFAKQMRQLGRGGQSAPQQAGKPQAQGDEQHRIWDPKTHYDAAKTGPRAAEAGSPAAMAIQLAGAQSAKLRGMADKNGEVELTPQLIKQLLPTARMRGLDYSKLVGHRLRFNIGPNAVKDQVGRAGQITHVLPPKGQTGQPQQAPQPGPAKPQQAAPQQQPQQGPRPAPQAPSAPPSDPPREQLHAAILKQAGAKQFGFTPQVLAKMPEPAVRAIAAQLGVGPSEALAPHVDPVPKTPAVTQAAKTAPQWAATHADRHADRVAQHFGISRQQAHALLVKAISAVGEHAAKGASVSIRDKRTGKTATLTRKAMSAIDDGAGGFLVPPECGKRRKKKRRLADEVLKSLGVV